MPICRPSGNRRCGALWLPGCAASPFEGGGTIIMDRDRMVEAADAAGFFILGLGPEALKP